MNVPIYYALRQCDPVTVENNTMPYMKSLYSCLNRMVGDGYTDDFKPTSKGIQSKRTNRVYRPQEIKIINFFRFEGNANPEDNVIMYIIETIDGLKGTLVNSFASAFQDNIMRSLFMNDTENLQ